MESKKPLMGFCPIGKFVFSHEDALRQKEAIRTKLGEWALPFVDLEGVLDDGIVRDQSHVEAVVRHFRAKGVECLFLPHCNFGTEGAVGMIARELGVPTLLWGPRDGPPLADGTRLRDTLCGMFASSKVLHKLGVPFTYVENCGVDDEAFRIGVDTFVRAAGVANMLRGGMRIGLVGQRIDFFWTTISNESELLERFKIEVRPYDMADFVRAAKDRGERGRAGYEKEAAALRGEMDVEGFDDDAPLVRILAVRDQLLALAADGGLDGMAVRDFTSLVDEMGAYCFLANGLAAERCPIACEADVHGAVTVVLLSRAAFDEQAVFLTDITVRHPEDDNAVLLWHAGAPVSMKHPDVRARLGTHWILPSPLAGMPHFRLKEGPITVARFDGDGGDYRLALGEGRSVDGPKTLNNYVWMKVADWPRWERTLMQGPFIHHAGMAYGRFGEALAEAARFVPGLLPVRLDGKGSNGT